MKAVQSVPESAQLNVLLCLFNQHKNLILQSTSFQLSLHFSTSHRPFLTENKGIKRSERGLKSLCPFFSECLRTKLTTVKVIPYLVFRKAMDNFLPTWMSPGNVCFDECSSLSWRVAAESKGKTEFSVAAGSPEASCLLFKGTYLDADRKSETGTKHRETPSTVGRRAEASAV